MSTELKNGQIIEGKVTGIQPYGAFVQLDDNTQGLVHISEVTHGFVKDVKEHLQVGETVKVKVLEVNEAEKKVALSIRATEEKPKSEKQPSTSANDKSVEARLKGFNTLKDKLEDWLKQSR